MKKSKNIEDSVKHIEITVSPELHDRVFGKLLKQIKETENQRSVKSQPNIWRIIMKSKITKFTAAALIIIAVIIGITQLGTPFDPTQAFAHAMDSAIQARTFSCKRIFQSTREGNENIFEDFRMFKEPDLERFDQMIPFEGTVHHQGYINNYATRKTLQYSSIDMDATIQDLIPNYVIDNDTGYLKLKQPKLSTEIRDRLLKWSEEAPDDLGMVQLDDQSVRLLQSQKGQNVFKIWLDPKTNLPVQIEINQLEYEQLTIYKSIQIDIELDDELFSLEPPEDYSLYESDAAGGWSDEYRMFSTKINYLNNLRFKYNNYTEGSDPHTLSEGPNPDTLQDLVTAGLVTDQVLQVVLASPDDPTGPSAIKYRKPNLDAEPSTELVFYQFLDHPPDPYLDTHIIVLTLARGGELSHPIPYHNFEQLLKPWSDSKKLLAYNMAYLHYFCCRFAEDNDQRFPQQLSDISAAEISSEEMVNYLQTADPLESWSLPRGPILSRYRPPKPDADPSTEVILYEIVDQWPNEGALVFYHNGQSELITDQIKFEELIK